MFEFSEAPPMLPGPAPSDVLGFLGGREKAGGIVECIRGIRVQNGDARSGWKRCSAAFLATLDWLSNEADD